MVGVERKQEEEREEEEICLEHAAVAVFVR